MGGMKQQPMLEETRRLVAPAGKDGALPDRRGVFARRVSCPSSTREESCSQQSQPLAPERHRVKPWDAQDRVKVEVEETAGKATFSIAASGWHRREVPGSDMDKQDHGELGAAIPAWAVRDAGFVRT